MAETQTAVEIGRKVACVKETIIRGDYLQKAINFKQNGFPIDLSSLSGDQLRKRFVVSYANKATTIALELIIVGAPDVLGFLYAPTVVSAASIDGAFLADNIVRASGADFVKNATKKNQTAVLTGTISNDGTYLVNANATADGQIVLKNSDGTVVTFTAEAAQGTITITDVSRFIETIPPGVAVTPGSGTLALDVREYNQELDLDLSGSPAKHKTIWQGTATVVGSAKD